MTLYFEITRKELTNPLKAVVSTIESKQTLPILANVLVEVENNTLRLTGTDAEVEINCTVPLEASIGSDNDGAITVPAKKFFDIVRALPDGAHIQFNQEDENRVVIKSGKSRFSLSCLPAEDYPSSPEINSTLSFNLMHRALKDLLAQTQYAMATNDVRYYLNGVCFDFLEDKLAVVATDGHRLALATEAFDLAGKETMQVIVPRKAIIELSRMLENSDDSLEISMDANHIKIVLSDRLTLASKLIDGSFPDYWGVLPVNPNRIVTTQTGELKQALTRTSILSNEKFKGIRFALSLNNMVITSRNPEQEEAEENLMVEYNGEEMEIGFNVTYLLDALSVMTTKEVTLHFIDTNSSLLITPKDLEDVKMVIMPMRL